jgi:hypothetical protein
MLAFDAIFLEQLVIGYCLLAGLGLLVALIVLLLQRR